MESLSRNKYKHFIMRREIRLFFSFLTLFQMLIDCIESFAFNQIFIVKNNKPQDEWDSECALNMKCDELVFKE